MLRIVKKSPVWEMDANGHVLDVKFFREVRRAGAVKASLSQEQWRGVFGKEVPKDPKLDGVKLVVDATLADDEVRFFEETGALVAVMRRLYVAPPEEE